jgi:cysteine synthase
MILYKQGLIDTKANIMDIASTDVGVSAAVMVMASGTWTGDVKLSISFDGKKFVPLLDKTGAEVILVKDKPTFMASVDGFLKVNATGATSSDLTVEVQ